MYRKKTSKKKYFSHVAGMILVLFLILVVLEKSNTIDLFKLSTTPVSSSDGPTEEQKKQEAQGAANTKKQLIDSQKAGPGSNTPASDTTQPSTVDLSAKQESNNTVTVFTKLAGYSNGSCVLVLTNGSKSTTQTAAIIYQPEFSSCAGFSVAIGQLSTGTWTLKLTVVANGVSTTKSIITVVR